VKTRKHQVGGGPTKKSKAGMVRRMGARIQVSIADTPEGLVVAHHVYLGNPADAETLQLAVATAKATGMRQDGPRGPRPQKRSYDRRRNVTSCSVTT
jgi:hypothetical protein